MTEAVNWGAKDHGPELGATKHQRLLSIPKSSVSWAKPPVDLNDRLG